MKNASLKHALHRGFTLIELMIVIVILGVLMGTILPRLTGAQARSRDTARIADLRNISQALETYYGDFGKYPGVKGTAYCIDNVEAVVGAKIKDYLKGGVTLPPSSDQATVLFATTCTGKYLYAPLDNRGVALNGYILASDVETYQLGNFDGDTKKLVGDITQVSAFTPVAGSTLGVADAADAKRTIYVLISG